MKPVNEAKLTFLSRSANEGFARTAAACFAAQLDPTLDEVNDIKTAVSEAESPSLPPAETTGPAWALPLWRALWIP